MMMRLIARTRSVFRFADIPNRGNKGVGQHLKTKQTQSTISSSSFSLEELSNSHRLLYVQFVPAALMALPAMYSLGDPTTLLFINSLDLLQYYLSGVLCFNSFFAQTSTYKQYLFLGVAAGVNCITGPYSLISPLMLALLNFYAPFTHEKHFKLESSEQEGRLKAYMRVQGLFYFLTGVLLTLKFYHYEEVRQLEIKLEKLEAKNKEFYQ